MIILKPFLTVAAALVAIALTANSYGQSTPAGSGFYATVWTQPPPVAQQVWMQPQAVQTGRSFRPLRAIRMHAWQPQYRVIYRQGQPPSDAPQ